MKPLQAHPAGDKTPVGAVGGFAVYFALRAVVANVIHVQTGVVLDFAAWHAVLWICPPAMITLSALVGIVPALNGYRIPVAETLAPVS